MNCLRRSAPVGSIIAAFFRRESRLMTEEFLPQFLGRVFMEWTVELLSVSVQSFTQLEVTIREVE